MLSVRWIMLKVFFLIYFSYIFFFDLRILSRRGLAEFVPLSTFLLAWGGLLLPIILYFLFRIKITSRNFGFILYFLLYILVGLILGLANGNAAAELLGDLYKAFFILAGIGIYFTFRHDFEQVLDLALKIGGAIVLVRTFLFLAYFGNPFGMYYGTSLDTVVGCLAMYKLFGLRKKSGRLGRMTSALLGLAIVLGQKRTVMLSLLTFIALTVRTRYAVVATMILVVVFLFYSGDWRSAGAFSRYLAVTDIAFILENQVRRFDEVLTAFDAWTSSTEKFLFGHGLGAGLHVYSENTATEGIFYSIHNTPMAVAFRSGALGLALMVWLVFLGVRDYRKNNSREGAMIISLFIGSFFFYSFIDEILVGTLVSVCLQRIGLRQKALGYMQKVQPNETNPPKPLHR